MSGADPQQLTADLRQAAEVRAKVDLALRAVADAEHLDCTDEELDEEIGGLAERLGQPVADVRDRLGRAGQLSAVRSDLRKRKALEWLLERVEVLDRDGAAIDRSELEAPAEDDDATSEPEEPTEEEAQADA